MYTRTPVCVLTTSTISFVISSALERFNDLTCYFSQVLSCGPDHFI